MLDDLKAEISKGLALYLTEPLHLKAAVRALSRPSYALHPKGPCRSAVITIETFRAISGSVSSEALKAASGVELYVEAGFLFDHVADQETDAQDGSSPAEELVLAISMMNCGAAQVSQAIIASKASTTALTALLRFYADVINACGGQYLDTHMENRETTTQEALKMTSLKAGSIGRFAAALGAALATDDEYLITSFGEMGFNLLTYMQLIDDIRDACPSEGPLRDYLQHKKTVPLVLFQESKQHPSSQNNNHDVIMAASGTEENFRRDFEASQASMFAAILAETFLNRAKNNLVEVQMKLGKSRVETLERFIEGIEFDPQDIRATPY